MVSAETAMGDKKANTATLDKLMTALIEIGRSTLSYGTSHKNDNSDFSNQVNRIYKANYVVYDDIRGTADGRSLSADKFQTDSDHLFRNTHAFLKTCGVL